VNRDQADRAPALGGRAAPRPSPRAVRTGLAGGPSTATGSPSVCLRSRREQWRFRAELLLSIGHQAAAPLGDAAGKCQGVRCLAAYQLMTRPLVSSR